MFDDQVAINNILYKCGIKWSNTSNSISHQLQAVTGQCAESRNEISGFKVTILPTSIICRKCYKKDKSDMYVWHKQSKKTGAAKKKAASTTDTWYLKGDYLNLMMSGNGQKEDLKGIKWIRALAKL